MLNAVISSDHHFHKWTQFSTTDSSGVNSRLVVILNEFIRMALVAIDKGIKDLYLAGDLFHVRGHIDPEVLNPVVDTFKKVVAMGLNIYLIPGNHDLASEETTELGNATQALSQIDGVTVITSPTLIGETFFVPWVKDLTHLRSVLAAVDKPEEKHLIIHAPVNGVLKGIPDHGLEADELKKLGFKSVSAGHYHNARDFKQGVRSIGATTHQTWSDVGTLAGFWVVKNDKFTFHESHAPRFVDYDESNLPECSGNYVRLKLQEATDEQIQQAKKNALTAGAVGIVDHSTKLKASVRVGSTASAGATLEASVSTFIDTSLVTTLDKKKVSILALAALSEARMMGDE